MKNSPLNIRIGNGFDVHAFDAPQHSSSLRLGGVDIPSDRVLKGHSDADVVLHALTDAILGASGKGDIGEHFPPSDDSFKDMDSAVFVKEALSMFDGCIGNIDITIICEAPKISPYKEAIAKRIAQICSIDQAQVNIKATTSEGLGFTGRGEGIACMASVILTLE